MLLAISQSNSENGSIDEASGATYHCERRLRWANEEGDGDDMRRWCWFGMMSSSPAISEEATLEPVSHTLTALPYSTRLKNQVRNPESWLTAAFLLVHIARQPHHRSLQVQTHT